MTSLIDDVTVNYPYIVSYPCFWVVLGKDYIGKTGKRESRRVSTQQSAKRRSEMALAAGGVIKKNDSAFVVALYHFLNNTNL